MKTIVLCFFVGLIASTSLHANSTSTNEKTAYFAGGCFWCVESDFEKLPGVIEVISGFSGGDKENPSYKQVSSGKTKHTEVVKIIYHSDQVSYPQLLDHLWRHIDPTDNQGQFVDRGQQYRPAIFYQTTQEKKQALASRDQLNRSGRFDKPINTEVTAFTTFYPAEDYHQNYYKHNSFRYNYYRYRSGRDQFLKKHWAQQDSQQLSTKNIQHSTKAKIDNKASHMAPTYSKPSIEQIKQNLSPLAFKVTQDDGTEPPFDNTYWDNKEDGIYVDVVSGEPLFSSLDKFDSGTGWPSFTQPLDDKYVVSKRDFKMIVPRTEVRSHYGDSHLGHVFKDGPQPTGLRYCINSAAMRFVKKSDLEQEGYGQYSRLFQ